MTEVRIENVGGGTTTLTHLESRQVRQLGKKWKAYMWVPRDAFNNVDLSEGDTMAYIVEGGADEFGGRIRDARYGSDRVKLIVDSFERDMIQAEPSGNGTGDDFFENETDGNVIENAVGRVSTVEEGDISEVESGLSYRFAYVSPARMARTVEETGGNLAYRPDGTLDYVEKLGSDKTDTTLTPDSSKIIGEFEVRRTGDDRRSNHLIMLGAGEGPSQVNVEVIADTFSSQDRQKWAAYVNKDLADDNTADIYGQALVNDLAKDYIEVRTTVIDQVVSIGDTFHLFSSVKNIDTDLRAVRVDKVISNKEDRYITTFANREMGRESTQEKLTRDVKKMGTSMEGFTVPLPISSGPAWTSPTHNHRFSIPMPTDIIKELKLNLRIRGLENYDPSDDTTDGNYPEGVDVLVNGSSLGLSFGDGNSAFLEEVDLSGELDQGEVNTIDITSDRQARTYAVLDADLYRRMTGD